MPLRRRNSLGDIGAVAARTVARSRYPLRRELRRKLRSKLRSFVEDRDRDKKGFPEFLPDPSISIHTHPRAILSLSTGLQASAPPLPPPSPVAPPAVFPPFSARSGERDVIQIRLIPVIFQSFIRHRALSGAEEEGSGWWRWDVAPTGEVWPHTLLCGRRRRLRQVRNPGITGLARARGWVADGWMREEKEVEEEGI